MFCEPRVKMRLMNVRPVWVFAMLSVSLACDVPTRPLRESESLPEITGIETDASRLVAGGLLSYTMVPTSLSFRLPDNTYLLATVRSSGGDVESLRIHRYICSAGEGLALCRYFIVFFDQGSGIEAIADDLKAFGIRAALVAPNGSFARLYPMHGRDGAMFIVRNLPGVQAVGDIPVGTIGIGPPPFSVLSAAIPFEPGAHVAGDGVLSAMPSDTIRFEYTSGTGITASHTFVVP
jgi:hypothetical protein